LPEAEQTAHDAQALADATAGVAGAADPLQAHAKDAAAQLAVLQRRALDWVPLCPECRAPVVMAYAYFVRSTAGSGV